MEKFSGPLARRYGTALFEALKDHFKNKKDFTEVGNFIKELSLLFTKDNIKILQTYNLSSEHKAELIQTLLDSVSDAELTDSKTLKTYLFNFFITILDHKRGAYIPHILDFYFKESDEYLDIVRAQIYSAKPMSSETLKKFEESIANNIQKKVVFSTDIDESLKCGFLLKLGSTHVDASLKSFLTKLNESVR